MYQCFYKQKIALDYRGDLHMCYSINNGITISYCYGKMILTAKWKDGTQ